MPYLSIEDLPPLPTPGYLTMTQAEERMGTSRDYLHRLRQLGVLVPVGRIDKVWMYREKDVIDYIITHPALGRVRAAIEQRDLALAQ